MSNGVKKINKNMTNKILFFAVTIAFFAIAATTFAATTVSLSPVNVSVVEGQNFNLVVSVNSQIVKSYMVKSEIKFPADVFEVESFNFGNNWVQLSQPGYNLTDNTNGVLIKTAGYPGGLSSQADFGTVVFKAKKSGTGTIKVTENSQALNAESLNVINGLPVTASITITQAQIVPSPTPATQTQQGAAVNPTTKVSTTPGVSNIPSLPVTEEKAIQPAAVPQVAAAAQQTSLVATIGSFLTFGTNNVWLGILMGLIILAIIGYAIYLLRKRKNSGEDKKI